MHIDYTGLLWFPTSILLNFLLKSHNLTELSEFPDAINSSFFAISKESITNDNLPIILLSFGLFKSQIPIV